MPDGRPPDGDACIGSRPRDVVSSKVTKLPLSLQHAKPPPPPAPPAAELRQSLPLPSPSTSS
eukprot:353778-Chlamydomonas_euryale.AAC.3